MFNFAGKFQVTTDESTSTTRRVFSCSYLQHSSIISGDILRTTLDIGEPHTSVEVAAGSLSPASVRFGVPESTGSCGLKQALCNCHREVKH
jgi:hypothetical protein